MAVFSIFLTSSPRQKRKKNGDLSCSYSSYLTGACVSRISFSLKGWSCGFRCDVPFLRRTWKHPKRASFFLQRKLMLSDFIVEQSSCWDRRDIVTPFVGMVRYKWSHNAALLRKRPVCWSSEQVYWEPVRSRRQLSSFHRSRSHSVIPSVNYIILELTYKSLIREL